MAHKCQTTCRALLCSYCLQHEFECWCTGVVRFQQKTEGTWLVTTMMIVISEVQMHRSTRWVLGSETTMPCNVRSRCDSFPPLTPIPCTLCTAMYLHLYVSIFSFVLYCIFLQLLYTLSILRLTPWQVCSRYIHTRDQHHAPWLRSPRPGEVTNMTSNIHHHAIPTLFFKCNLCRCCSHHQRLTIMLS